MEELLEIKNNEAVTTSLIVAESFGKRHDSVLRAIEDLIGTPHKNVVSNDTKNVVSEMFYKSNYKDTSGKHNTMYYINREAFNKMEKLLTEKNTELWIEAKKEGKLTRKAEADTIKSLIEYAKEQGSEHSEKLYMVYSKLANHMSGIKDRDIATFRQLSELSFIENIILNQIEQGMKRDMNYKDIYQDCKKQIILFKDIAYLT